MSKDFYEELAKPEFEMEMYPKEDPRTLIKIYGGAFLFVILGIAPWAVGCCMFIKWGFQLIF